MPATTPVATGSMATSKAGREAKATSINAPMSTVPAMASWCTSVWICARLSTPNSGAPLIWSVSPSRPGVPVFSAAKLLRTVSMVACWASRSAPGALLTVTSKARSPWREDHTPSTLRGALLGIRPSAMRTVSPVGSRSSSGLMAPPAGVPSRLSVSSMPSRSPAALKRWALTAGLRW